MSARYLTLAQVSERITTPIETLRYWVHIGRLPASKPGRQVLVKETDLDALMEGAAVPTTGTRKARPNIPRKKTG